MEIFRGNIFYISRTDITGSEQEAGRPAIVVSNDMNNQYSATVEVVYLTTQPKTDLPTHVTINSTSRPSTALCEQVCTVAISRIGDYVGNVTENEMKQINTALLISLDLYIPPELTAAPNPDADTNYESSLQISEETYIQQLKLTIAKTERDVYKSMYENLLELVIGKK